MPAVRSGRQRAGIRPRRAGRSARATAAGAGRLGRGAGARAAVAAWTRRSAAGRSGADHPWPARRDRPDARRVAVATRSSRWSAVRPRRRLRRAIGCRSRAGATSSGGRALPGRLACRAARARDRAPRRRRDGGAGRPRRRGVPRHGTGQGALGRTGSSERARARRADGAQRERRAGARRRRRAPVDSSRLRPARRSPAGAAAARRGPASVSRAAGPCARGRA